MPSKIKILGPADRNKHGQACVLVQCSCGSPAFVTRADSVDQERTTSCGFCRKGGRKRKAAQVLDLIPTSEVVPEVESTFKRGTPAWFDDEITHIDAAATASENRARYLEKEIAAQEVTDLDTHKRWNVESTTAHKMRQHIARLQIEKANAETATKKDTRTQAEITREKVAALRGDK